MALDAAPSGSMVEAVSLTTGPTSGMNSEQRIARLETLMIQMFRSAAATTEAQQSSTNAGLAALEARLAAMEAASASPASTHMSASGQRARLASRSRAPGDVPAAIRLDFPDGGEDDADAHSHYLPDHWLSMQRRSGAVSLRGYTDVPPTDAGSDELVRRVYTWVQDDIMSSFDKWGTDFEAAVQRRLAEYGAAPSAAESVAASLRDTVAALTQKLEEVTAADAAATKWRKDTSVELQQLRDKVTALEHRVKTNEEAYNALRTYTMHYVHQRRSTGEPNEPLPASADPAVQEQLASLRSTLSHLDTRVSTLSGLELTIKSTGVTARTADEVAHACSAKLDALLDALGVSSEARASAQAVAQHGRSIAAIANHASETADAASRTSSNFASQLLELRAAVAQLQDAVQAGRSAAVPAPLQSTQSAPSAAAASAASRLAAVAAVKKASLALRIRAASAGSTDVTMHDVDGAPRNAALDASVLTSSAPRTPVLMPNGTSPGRNGLMSPVAAARSVPPLSLTANAQPDEASETVGPASSAAEAPTPSGKPKRSFFGNMRKILSFTGTRDRSASRGGRRTLRDGDAAAFESIAEEPDAASSFRAPSSVSVMTPIDRGLATSRAVPRLSRELSVGIPLSFMAATPVRRTSTNARGMDTSAAAWQQQVAPLMRGTPTRATPAGRINALPV